MLNEGQKIMDVAQECKITTVFFACLGNPFKQVENVEGASWEVVLVGVSL